MKDPYSSNTDSPDTSRCPICGAANNCAMAMGTAEAGECWCATAHFSDALLARVPPEARNRACICPTCAGPPEPAP